eukprot:jgi/Tetstr1/453997/TSEL_040916.t1
MTSSPVCVTIDSRDRESAADSPGSYTVRFLEDVRDVCTVKMRSADIPPQWNIPRGRSSIWVSGGGVGLREAVVEPADHTEATAAAAVAAALEAVIPLTWSASFGPTGRLSLTASGPFTIRGGDGNHPDGYGPTSAGRALGFGASERASDGANTIVAPHRHQLDRPETMYLHIEDFDAVHGATSGIHNCLEVLNACGTDHEIAAEKHFHPPLARIDRLRVRVVDYYGNTVDFDNREHRIDLQFITRDSAARVGRGYAPTR